MSTALVRDHRPLIALDIGGANIKVAHSSGQAPTIPFEVWKRPDELGRAIAGAVAALPPSNLAAPTMTAELCDCYATKAVGVRAVLDAAVEGLRGRSIVVWGIDGEFHSLTEIRSNPGLAAAANWLVLVNAGGPLDPGIAGDLDRHRHDDGRPHSARLRQVCGAGGATPNGSRPASLFTRAFAELPFVRSRPSCHYGEPPPSWPRSSSLDARRLPGAG